ncbi:MAG: DMT family transporter [Kutzneria sp.]|nr:DMT family transporter [Kutzneria sp.]
MNSVVLSLVAALGYGLSDFVGGLAARKAPVLRVVLVTYPLGLAGLLLVAPMAGGGLHGQGMLPAVASGIANGLAVMWFYAALATGPMNVVSPLTALLVAGIPLVFGLVTGERLGPVTIGGALLAVVAVVLVSREERSAVDEGDPVKFTTKVAWLTVGSGLAFGAYFVLLDKIDPGSGLWGLVVSRGAASLLVLLFAVVTGQSHLPGRPALMLAASAGVLDTVSGTSFLYALRSGLLSIASVLTALYPAITVLMARLVLGERTGRAQRVGLALAAVSVTLITGGSSAA